MRRKSLLDRQNVKMDQLSYLSATRTMNLCTHIATLIESQRGTSTFLFCFDFLDLLFVKEVFLFISPFHHFPIITAELHIRLHNLARYQLPTYSLNRLSLDHMLQ